MQTCWIFAQTVTVNDVWPQIKFYNFERFLNWNKIDESMGNCLTSRNL